MKTKREDYKKAYNLLSDYWHEFSDDTQVYLDKELKKVGL